MNKKINKSTEQVLVMCQPYLSRTAALMAVVLAISIFLYSAFLLEAVAHAASKTTAQNQIKSISEQLSTLEAQYLALTQSMTPEKAAALGFVAPTDVVSMYAKPESGSLSFRGI